jgi:hypothetical protein
MTLLACWLLFPAVLCLILLGLGLIVDWISGNRLHGNAYRSYAARVGRFVPHAGKLR